MKVTDNELAAVAVAAGHAWRGHLPTIDDSEVSSLLASVEQGAVSLVARDLLPEDGVATDGTLRAAQVVAGSEPIIRMYVADAESIGIPVGLVAELHAVGAAKFVVDLSRPDGLHHLEVLDSSGAYSFVESALRSAYEDGVEVDGARFVFIAMLDSGLDVQVVDRLAVLQGAAQPGESSFALADVRERPELDLSSLDELLRGEG